ncbi:MAG: pentaheme c-type cytochrome TorC, partial [Gammaproteobacteria bacterium]|nr:pentaheme c-type cytochrome TorC [Gammaproteobacteria bacterium]
VVQVEDDRLKIEVEGWRRTKGFGRVINEQFGYNISSGFLSKVAAQNDQLVNGFERKEDDMTGLEWERVSTTLWMKAGSLAKSPEPIWEFAQETYRDSCSVCHTQPDENHFDANTWPGMFNGMLSFVNLDGDSQAVVLKYLQKHSSDFTASH